MKFDLKINISTEGLIENYKKLDEINLFDNYHNDYYFYLNAVALLEENKLCNDIKRLHISIVYLYLKILEIMHYMCFGERAKSFFEESALVKMKIYFDILEKTKIEVSDNQTVFHLKMAIEKEENDNCLPYKEKLEKNKKLRSLKEKGFMYMPIRNGIVESYTVEELVKRAITATCLDNSFVPSELREFLLYNITFEFSECEEETNEHEEEVNIPQEEDNIDDQTANLEPSQIDSEWLAKRTYLIIEAPNSKIKRLLESIIYSTERGHNFQDEYATVDVVLNEDIHKKEKTITAFFTFKPDVLSLLKIDKFAETLRKMQELFAISLLNIMRTDKRLKKYVVRAEKEARARGEK